MSKSTTYNESDLLAHIAVKDEEAFRVLFHRYFKPLCFFANSFIEDIEAAKDIVQEVLYKLWNRKENFSTPENVKAFLYISVKNACLNYLKAEQRRSVRQEEMLHLAEQNQDFVEMLAVKEELLQKILQEIEMLPVKYRNIIKLAFVEGLSHQEIAERMAIPAATVRKQKERGLKLLQAAVLKKKLSSIVCIIPALAMLMETP